MVVNKFPGDQIKVTVNVQNDGNIEGNYYTHIWLLDDLDQSYDFGQSMVHLILIGQKYDCGFGGIIPANFKQGSFLRAYVKLFDNAGNLLGDAMSAKDIWVQQYTVSGKIVSVAVS